MFGVASSTAVSVLCIVVLGLTVAASAFLKRRTMAVGEESGSDEAPPALLWRRRRVAGLGLGLAGGALFAGCDVWVLGVDRGSPAVWLVISIALLGSVVGLAAVRVPRVRAEGPGPRVAYSRHVGFKDLVSRPLRLGARLMVVLAMAVLVATTALLASREGLMPYLSARFPLWAFLLDPNVLMTVMAVVSVTAFEILGRKLARRSTKASDVMLLSLEVRIRRDALGDLAWAAVLTGGLAVLLAGPTLLELLGLTPPAPSTITAYRAVVNSAAAVAVLAIAIRPMATSHQSIENTAKVRGATS